MVGELDDPHAKLVEDGQPREVVLDGRGVLEAQYHPNLAFALGAAYIVDAPDLHHRAAVLFEPRRPLRDLVQRLLKALPSGDGGVYRRNAADGEVLVHAGAIPVADVQPIDDDGLVIHLPPNTLGLRTPSEFAPDPGPVRSVHFGAEGQNRGWASVEGR